MKRSLQCAKPLVSTHIAWIFAVLMMLAAVKPLCDVAFAADKDKLWLERSFKTPAGKRRQANMLMCIILGNATLDFFVIYRNEVLAAVETKYAENF